MDNPTFESFGLGAATLAAIARKGFEEPTPIQALTIPRLLKPGPDLIARARTGTGKTAAFGIPFAELLSERAPKVRALVLVPTRELALQVSGELVSLRSGERPRVAPVYGGASMSEQLRRLGGGVDVVVGTPGRVLDHLGRGTLDLSGLEFLVLDEADEMLDMGFIEDIEKIMEECASERRVVLFSATMPAGIVHVAKRRLGEYETVEDFSEAVATELAEQVWLEVREADKLEALCRVMDVEEDFYGIVFTSTRVEADKIAKALEERGYDAEALHGEITQDRRERILARFRDRHIRVLVATDVAARGIDIERLTHVVNWSLPHDPEAYVHRVGRTGRAGNAGTALTLVTPEEYRKLFRFKKASGGGLKKAQVPAVGEVLSARSERIRERILERAASLAQEGVTESAAESTADSAKDNALGAAGSKAHAGTKAASKAEAAVSRSALWSGMADELLNRLGAREALAAVLQEAFGSELDPARYHTIAEVSVDAAATARLFIGAGKRDHATPRGLASLVKRLADLPDRLVGGIEVYETFSFVTVPFEAAERVIARARSSGGLPAVRLATPRGSGLLDESKRRQGARRAPFAKKTYAPRRGGSSEAAGEPRGARTGKSQTSAGRRPRNKS
jgi:ATP-dependent RNA helicase DeaD